MRLLQHGDGLMEGCGRAQRHSCTSDAPSKGSLWPTAHEKVHSPTWNEMFTSSARSFSSSSLSCVSLAFSIRERFANLRPPSSSCACLRLAPMTAFRASMSSGCHCCQQEVLRQKAKPWLAWSRSEVS